MVRKTQTIDLKGKAYATVPQRLKLFREDCPHGFIETSYETLEGITTFKARIIKDKSDPHSAESIAHSRSEKKGEKDFEKLETIAVGRALANLGYLASGDIASAEEMEEFIEYKQTKQEEKVIALMDQVDAIETVEELRAFYLSNKGNGKEFDTYISEKGKALKTKTESDASA